MLKISPVLDLSFHLIGYYQDGRSLENNVVNFYDYRVLWLLVVLAALGAFFYLNINNLVTLRSYPKSVNVEVSYVDSLTFPATTVCNYNYLRYVIHLFMSVSITDKILFQQYLERVYPFAKI